jgi:anaerobic ribonucleoside-triphosphate reductase activating protein
MSELKLAGFLPRSSVNGPGIRAVVWVQGCPVRCQGCFNPGFLPFSNGCLITVRNLAEKILAIDGIDGVTFSGGEPFAQAVPLAELGALVHQAGLSVVTFTGYTWVQLNAKNRPSWYKLLSVTDILIAGPYVPEKAAMVQRYAGSTGKQAILLVEGRPANGRVCDSLIDPGSNNEIEFSLLPDGRMVVTGFPGNRLVGEMVSLSSGE